jgi:dUTP pyrophosphatase
LKPVDIEVIVTDPRVNNYGLPSAQTLGSAGLDLRVFCQGDMPGVFLRPGDQVTMDTGLRVWIKDSRYAGFMFARSGLGVKGLVLGNGTGVIDADYQGPLKVCLWNRGTQNMTIKNGDRVAQLVIMPVASGYNLRQVTEFSDGTDRGDKGFGSSGVA